MAVLIILPDGRRVIMDQVREYFPQSNALSFIGQAGFVTQYKLANDDALAVSQSMASQIDTVVSANTPGPTLIYEPIQISISPSSFDIVTDTLTIDGIGFDSATVGKLYFEDASGGRDNNGYYCNCTFVSNTQMTAVYGGPGDSGLGPGAVIIYYVPTDNKISNAISATNPSGTLITIP